jgi:HSP20 family molecular chaperone IbpA
MERRIYRRYELPTAINTELVRATLDIGVLEIVGPKMEVSVLSHDQPEGVDPHAASWSSACKRHKH